MVREELTYEMLILEPRTSDDETPESEASIGTADSTENITTQGASADPSGKCVCSCIYGTVRTNPTEYRGYFCRSRGILTKPYKFTMKYLARRGLRFGIV